VLNLALHGVHMHNKVCGVHTHNNGTCVCAVLAELQRSFVGVRAIWVYVVMRQFS
jgi:hypothetical protein